MTRKIISPGKYIQGKGEMRNISKYVCDIGSNFFFLISNTAKKRVASIINESFKYSGDKIIYEKSNGNCTEEEIERLRQLFKGYKCDAIVGVGGGKILDMAKAVAYYEEVPVVIVPTVVTTNTPCSALAVIYNKNGNFDKYLYLPKNPEIVIVDVDVIANAPAKFLVAGMGEALSTYFEARACIRANATNNTGAYPTLAAEELSKLSYKVLLQDGLKAKLAVERNVATKAVENIIEACILLSGIGFESGGLAAAHSISNGFTILDECKNLYHGEKVAFGTIVQLVLENSDINELNEVIAFCKSVGLPTTLRDMGIMDVKDEQIHKIADISCNKDETIHNMLFEVNSDMVYAAILTADKLGRLNYSKTSEY